MFYYRTFVILLIVLSFLLLNTKSVLAAGDFVTDYDVTVTIDRQSIAHVVQKSTITNQSAGIYAKEYKLTVAALKLQNIKAKSNLGPLKPESTEADGKTTITIPFNEKVIGKDKKYGWELSYDSADYVKSDKNIRTITIPRATVTDGLGEYSLQVVTPKNLGTPSTISPKPIKTDQNYSQITYQFKKDDVLAQNIVFTYGDAQYYAFTMAYTLLNSNLIATTKDVILPPTTPYQSVVIDSLLPKPDKVRVDADGNWLASYMVESNKEVTVVASGRLKTFPKAQFQTQLAKIDERRYLESQPYWETTQPKILATIQSLFPNTDVSKISVDEKARRIYQYVTQNLALKVSDQAQTRKGAVKALEAPQESSAAEFADTFVALCRAVGVPARVVVGFVTPGDLNLTTMHPWAEYWSENTWRPVDPTLGYSTNGTDYLANWDVKHITFILWGMNSAQPFPEGLFTLTEEKHPTKLQVIDSFTMPIPDVTVSVTSQSQAVAGLTGRGEIVLKNNGSTAAVNTILSASAPDLKVQVNKTVVPVVPPYGSVAVPFTYQTPHLFQVTRSVITVMVNDKPYTLPIQATPFAGRIKALLVFPVIAGVLIGLLVYTGYRKRAKRKQS